MLFLRSEKRFFHILGKSEANIYEFPKSSPKYVKGKKKMKSKNNFGDELKRDYVIYYVMVFVDVFVPFSFLLLLF